MGASWRLFPILGHCHHVFEILLVFHQRHVLSRPGSVHQHRIVCTQPQREQVRTCMDVVETSRPRSQRPTRVVSREAAVDHVSTPLVSFGEPRRPSVRSPRLLRERIAEQQQLRTSKRHPNDVAKEDPTRCRGVTAPHRRRWRTKTTTWCRPKRKKREWCSGCETKAPDWGWRSCSRPNPTTWWCEKQRWKADWTKRRSCTEVCSSNTNVWWTPPSKIPTWSST
mmetsp:Transcript_6450/g.40311  ORF Transcript_6450/g.40311 Transcript_6450/m.40311 type:complete len:224 (-) Transcript_6450:2947-3618(-)